MNEYDQAKEEPDKPKIVIFHSTTTTRFLLTSGPSGYFGLK